MLRFLDFSMMMTTYLLGVPLFQIYLTVLVCVKEREAYGDLVCYQGMYFLHFVVAFIGIIMHLVISISCNLYHSDLNPFSKAPCATVHSRPQLYRLWVKLTIVLLALLTYKV